MRQNNDASTRGETGQPASATRPGLSRRSLSAQLGGMTCPTTAGIVPPMHLATTFLRNPFDALQLSPVYARSDNPGYPYVERVIASLEGGQDCLIYSSGMAAAASVVFSLKPGDRIIAQTRFYAGLWEWFTKFVEPWQIKFSYVDFSDEHQIESVLKEPSRTLVWLETPTTPGLDIVSIASVCSLAHRYGALVLVDNTSATPALTQPISFGADLVLHSATKALNGHDDVIAGALVTAKDDEFWAQIKSTRNKNGGILGSFENWLLGRGLRTLFQRVEASCDAALLVAEELEKSHSTLFSEIRYPGLRSHPGHLLAREQMSGRYGNMITLRMAGGEVAAKRLMLHVKLWRAGTSFGGVQSMLEHRASVEANYPPTSRDLVRLSVGLEEPSDLIDDLVQASKVSNLETRPARTFVVDRTPEVLRGLRIAAGDVLATNKVEHEQAGAKTLFCYLQRTPHMTTAPNLLAPSGLQRSSVACYHAARIAGCEVLVATPASLVQLLGQLSKFTEEPEDEGAAQTVCEIRALAEDANAGFLMHLIGGTPVCNASDHDQFKRDFPHRGFINWRYATLMARGHCRRRDADHWLDQGDLVGAILATRAAATNFALAYALRQGLHCDNEAQLLRLVRVPHHQQRFSPVTDDLHGVFFGGPPNVAGYRAALNNCLNLKRAAEGMRQAPVSAVLYAT